MNGISVADLEVAVIIELTIKKAVL